MNIVLRLLPILVALTVASPASAQSKVDEAAIRKLAERWELAWNQHDMHALAALFTVDADFVNVGGRHWNLPLGVLVQAALQGAQPPSVDAGNSEDPICSVPAVPVRIRVR